MPDLIAQGPHSQQRWRRQIPKHGKIVLGRAADTWSVPWDDCVSRRHAELHWHHGALEVQQVSTARNPIYLRGQPTIQFELRPGEHFVIGDTTFTLSDGEADVSLDVPAPLQEHTYSTQDLQRIRYRNADHRLDVLSRLPDVILGATTDTELFVRLVNLLLAGINRADAAALVAVDNAPEADEELTDEAIDGSQVRILHWDRRLSASGRFRPSERLIREAVVVRQQSVLHIWGGRGNSAQAAFTVSEDVDWAFCTPLRGPTGTNSGIYVAGRFSTSPTTTPTPTDPTDLRDDMKFTELVASVVASLRQVRVLQQQQAVFSQFFSPLVLEALAGNPELMTPRQTEVAVLFCDLRGFSRKSEKLAGDLLGLLERVSKALGVMTRHILEQGGVVGDFQGDAAMGFWGWPLAQDDAVERACTAALGIRTAFEAAARDPDNLLADFEMGIGIATGTAVAGQIGTIDQGKVTVFGPVVNLASRLEGMTKLLRAPILLDETTARLVRERVGDDVARLRRVAHIKPYGMGLALTVTELVPPLELYPELSDEDIQFYESALEQLLAGDWQQAFQLLHRVSPDDRVKDFLTVFIAQHNRTPPADWNGVIPLSSKS